MLTVATWNVNSINVRVDSVATWLGDERPDVVLLQELKCPSEKFPAAAFEALGYSSVVNGQKSYNGVAILSRHAMEDTVIGLPGGTDDQQARYIEATIRGVRVVCLYLPNGNPPGTIDDPSDKYLYKLDWMRRLRNRIETLLDTGLPLVVGGDYNVIPAEIDCHDVAAWSDDALYLLPTRQRFREILNIGLTDAWRALHPTEVGYSFWDYQKGAWDRNHGVRIDHLLLGPEATDRLRACRIDPAPRGRTKASDHTPVIAELAEPG